MPAGHGDVLGETSAFSLPPDAGAWLGAYRPDNEGQFTEYTAATAPGGAYSPPALFATDGGYTLLAVHPADLHRRPCSRLQGRRPVLDQARDRAVDLARRRPPGRPGRASPRRRPTSTTPPSGTGPTRPSTGAGTSRPTSGTSLTSTGRPTAGCRSSWTTPAPRASGSSSTPS
ncbi:hypothetical protein [Streptomyces coeruleorubidus]|uniref:hypothetical protein n=1 Tax=Streptomyces coeruleorubidus TaxID=116188 RepID=UPI003F541EAD